MFQVWHGVSLGKIQGVGRQLFSRGLRGRLTSLPVHLGTSPASWLQGPSLNRQSQQHQAESPHSAVSPVLSLLPPSSHSLALWCSHWAHLDNPGCSPPSGQLISNLNAIHNLNSPLLCNLTGFRKKDRDTFCEWVGDIILPNRDGEQAYRKRQNNFRSQKGIFDDSSSNPGIWCAGVGGGRKGRGG